MKWLLAIALVCIASAPVHAQTVHEQCADVPAVEACRLLADVAVSLAARTALIASGGNPVSGTASTLGMRLPGSPRFSAALRGTMARIQVPDVTGGTREQLSFTGGSVSLDAGLGVFNGVNIAPTIGGFASLDVLASAGVLSVSGSGFETGSALTWGAGARLGILRESFTAPAISVSAMYRRAPDIERSLGPERTGSHHVSAEDIAVVSLRGAVGKRVLGVGLTGGVGYDRTRSDARITHRVFSPGGGGSYELSDGITEARLLYFGNLSYTTTILSLVGELGWQQHGDRAAGMHRSTRRGGVFGSAAIRLAI